LPLPEIPDSASGAEAQKPPASVQGGGAEKRAAATPERKASAPKKAALPDVPSVTQREVVKPGQSVGGAELALEARRKDSIAAAPPPRITARDTTPAIVIPPPPPPDTAAARTRAANAVDSSALRKVAEPRPPADSVLIGRAVARYERALEARDIAAMRAAYPGMTPQQERAFRDFFDTIRSLSVTLKITDLRITDGIADAHLAADYEYVTREGQTQKQPSTFSISLRRDSAGWILLSLR
jgi:hypothetical protein